MRLWLWSTFSLSLFWKYLEQGRLNVAWFQFAIICTEEWSSSEIIKYFCSLKSQKHKLSLPTNNHLIQKLYKKERRTKPCCCQVVQISLLCALAGQMAGDDNSGHDSHCHPQNLRALLPLQIIAEEVWSVIFIFHSNVIERLLVHILFLCKLWPISKGRQFQIILFNSIPL